MILPINTWLYDNEAIPYSVFCLWFFIRIEGEGKYVFPSLLGTEYVGQFKDGMWVTNILIIQMKFVSCLQKNMNMNLGAVQQLHL